MNHKLVVMYAACSLSVGTEFPFNMHFLTHCCLEPDPFTVSEGLHHMQVSATQAGKVLINVQ